MKRSSIIHLFLILVLLTAGSVTFGEDTPENKATVHRIFRLSHRTPGDMAQLIKIYLSKDGVWAADERTGSLIVRDYPENLEQISKLIEGMDIPAPQVRITVKSMGTMTGESSGFYASARPAGGGWRFSLNPRYSKSGGHDSSVMNLVTLSGTDAFIRVGEQVPERYVTWFYDYSLRRGYVAQGVVFRDVSSGFYVTPQVRGDSIYLEVAPGISFFNGKNKDRIIFREARASVLLKDGQGILLGVGDSAKSESHGLISRIAGFGSSSESQVFSIYVSASIIKTR